MKADLAFHSVGQGLFHSGIVTSGSGSGFRKFSFIYDCGGDFSPESPARREVKMFLNYLEKRQKRPYLDLLIISHFHEDHINGLEELFRGETTVDLAVIPYYRKEDLLAAAAQADELSGFLLQFYSDPVATLTRAGVQKIIMVSGSNDAPPFDGVEWIRIDSERNDPRHNDLLHSDTVTISSNSPMFKNYRAEHNSEHYLISGTFSLMAKTVGWDFAFYGVPVDRDALDDFHHFFDRWRDGNKPLDIPALLENKDFIQEAKKAYDQLHENRNMTSLLTYHAPYASIRRCRCLFSRCRPVDKVGTLLTGDMDASSDLMGLDAQGKIALNADMLGDIGKRIAVRRNALGVLQVPHHGANPKNPYPWHLFKPDWLVLSYGIGNKYQHPRYETILRYKHSDIRLVNQYQGVSYLITVTE